MSQENYSINRQALDIKRSFFLKKKWAGQREVSALSPIGNTTDKNDYIKQKICKLGTEKNDTETKDIIKVFSYT